MKKKLIPISQYGFTPNRGSTYAITSLIEIINYILINKKEINIINLDYEKAFDLVSHEMVISLMK